LLEVHLHRHFAAEAFGDAHHLRGAAIARRHKVDHPHPTAIGLEVSLEDQRSLSIAPCRRFDVRRRADPPAAMALVAEQGGKAGRRVDVRQAQPVDRPISAHDCARA
jgi:hypothetical protein